MNDAKKFYLNILISICIYCILTIPYICDMMFGFGYEYSFPLIIICAILFPIILTPFIMKKLKL